MPSPEWSHRLIRSRQAFIHIGLEKTGSTYFQDFIFLNRELFAEIGLFVSPKLGLRNHSRLVLLGNSTHDPYTKINKWYKVSLEMLEASNDSLINNLKKDLASSHSLIASSEFLSSVLTQEHQVLKLQKNLQRIFENSQMFVYVRKQEDLIVSRYSTEVIAGSAMPFPISLQYLRVPEAIDVVSICKRWHNVFGDKITVLPYVENSSPKDLVFRFLEKIDLGSFSISNFIWPERSANQRLSANALEVIRQLNTQFGSIPKNRKGELLEYLSTRTQLEPKFTCSVNMYRTLQTHFQSTNEYIASYLPKHERTLFLYPQVPVESQLDLNLVQELLNEAIAILELG